MGYSHLSLYVAGSIRGLNAREIIEKFKKTKKYIEKQCKEKGIECTIYIPTRGKHTSNDGEIWASNYSLKDIIARDEGDVKRSDLILILTGDNPTDGTWLEFG